MAMHYLEVRVCLLWPVAAEGFSPSDSIPLFLPHKFHSFLFLLGGSQNNIIVILYISPEEKEKYSSEKKAAIQYLLTTMVTFKLTKFFMKMFRVPCGCVVFSLRCFGSGAKMLSLAQACVDGSGSETDK
jgi:hypothetical protein